MDVEHRDICSDISDPIRGHTARGKPNCEGTRSFQPISGCSSQFCSSARQVVRLRAATHTPQYGSGRTNTGRGSGSVGAAPAPPPPPRPSGDGGPGNSQGGSNGIGDGVLGAPIASSPIAPPPPFNPFNSPQVAASPPTGQELNSLPANSPPLPPVLSSPVGGSGGGAGEDCGDGQGGLAAAPPLSAPVAAGPASLGTILIPISGGASAPQG
ncbi:hypothetical protein COOONC_01894 [Cooperia oncophora]